MVSANPAEAPLCRDALREAGFQIELELARTAEGFSALLAAKPFQIVLAEENLPGWSGLAALALLRQRGKDIPFILLTATSPDKSVVDSLQQWSGDFVRRDHLIYLPMAVRRALEGRSQREECLSLEAQLHHSQKMEAVGRLAAGVAHDFNNILTVIQGHVGLLRSEPNLRAETSESLQQVSRATERAGKLVHQLLAFTRDHAPQPQRLDLNEVLTNLSMLLRRTLGEDVAVQLSCAPDLPAIQADRSLVEQVVLDLAVNAREAMPTGGQLVLSTAEVDIGPAFVAGHPEASVGRFVCLSIIDTGGGMEPEKLAGIFELNFNPKESASNANLLAMAHGIVKREHGWIEAQSRLGQGSTFRIFLPAASAEERTEKRVGRAIRGGTETILVVEDEPPVLWITRNILEHHGYHVLEATSGLEALAVWHQHQNEIALLLADIVMPVGVSGPELAEQFKQQKHGLKVLYTSGYSADAAAKQLELVPGINFLQKPYDAERLTVTVRNCLDR